MAEPVGSARAMIAGMSPRLDGPTWIFCTGGPLIRTALATFREDEGQSQILALEDAVAAGFSPALPMRRIVLEVHSALDGVGLTAAVATALAEAGIACNVVAAYYHDHLFVPAQEADRAIAALRRLQRGAQSAG